MRSSRTRSTSTTSRGSDADDGRSEQAAIASSAERRRFVRDGRRPGDGAGLPRRHRLAVLCGVPVAWRSRTAAAGCVATTTAIWRSRASTAPGFIIETPNMARAIPTGPLGSATALQNSSTASTVPRWPSPKRSRAAAAADGITAVVSGCVGPRGDGYDPGNAMTPEEAERLPRRCRSARSPPPPPTRSPRSP